MNLGLFAEKTELRAALSPILVTFFLNTRARSGLTVRMGTSSASQDIVDTVGIYMVVGCTIPSTEDPAPLVQLIR